ncbi:hypothetical protein BDN70DRAFT_934817 [Pholiota conissans]|uniref:Sodium/calcium exchanger membrane region domain-containing protein n=1 Tax=Pholiota conissans TaxID=109636 RepID=A0A9P6CYI6_9AGAR|nr:hypothetical protein BDN70DRAFT_934817 [Pholiota conissans]
MSKGAARFVFVVLLVLNCVLWSRSRYGQPLHSSLLHGEASLVKRISFELSQPLEARLTTRSEHEATFPTDDQCHHVDADCPAPNTVLHIDYLRHYFCTEITLRPLVFVGLVVWLMFLFSTLGISASDFFTPNLATISGLLGLDENVAGVTLLAFGNGSPDVFSTFSAMRANSGSLAIGELLGASTFIVSCVVGSMCIIKPFQVHRGPFLRDVGFFTLAVSLVLVTLWDSKISRWEAGSLVALYLIYVMLVIVGTWWEKRKERLRSKELQDRSEYAEENFPPYTDEPLPTLSVTSPTSPRLRAISAPNPPRLQMNLPPRPQSRSPSPVSTHVTQLPSFSLVGALEFRDVVASLQKEAAGNSLGIFETPTTPYAGGHYHTPIPRRSPRSSLNSSLTLDEEAMHTLRLGTRTSLSPSSGSTARQGRRERDLLEPDDYFQSQSTPPVPTILRTPASPSITASEIESEEALYTPYTRWQRCKSVMRRTYHILFPTLHSLRKQTVLAQLACILAAPAVLALTLTLPVVITPYDTARLAPEKMYNSDSRLVEFEEEGMERVLIAEEETQEEMHELTYNKWLMAVQCVLGPLFTIRVLFGGIREAPWLLLGALTTGISVAVLVLIFSEKGNSPSARLMRCSAGFAVSVVWIMAIADEVVNVLQTFGLIFGLSDAIIGLTIFAVGNSLADLVANMSVAAFAPIMGFSACFGGPMLNILLGIGVSGSYVIHKTSQPYHLKLSSTLLVSSFGLLFLLAATLIFVPLNDYFLTRRWGVVLIASYTIIMIVNIIVELKS